MTAKAGPCKIAVRDLNFYYGDFQALKNINMEIVEKEVTAFIGPPAVANPRCCAASTGSTSSIPAQGPARSCSTAELLEKSVDLNVLRSKIGMVFQKPTPFPMSIYDNIAFGVDSTGKSQRTEMDDRSNSRWQAPPLGRGQG